MHSGRLYERLKYIFLDKNVFKPFAEVKKKLGGTKVHAVINNKGGTGKSTITVSLAYELSQEGFKVLVIDTDSQASTTQLLNIFSEDEDDRIFSLDDIYQHQYEHGGVISCVMFENSKNHLKTNMCAIL